MARKYLLSLVLALALAQAGARSTPGQVSVSTNHADSAAAGVGDQKNFFYGGAIGGVAGAGVIGLGLPVVGGGVGGVGGLGGLGGGVGGASGIGGGAGVGAGGGLLP